MSATAYKKEMRWHGPKLNAQASVFVRVASYEYGTHGKRDLDGLMPEFNRVLGQPSLAYEYEKWSSQFFPVRNSYEHRILVLKLVLYYEQGELRVLIDRMMEAPSVGSI
eukprot:scaffold23342_cov14-Prasinocladus_malaysianus.AAC.1